MEQGNHNTKAKKWEQLNEKERYKIEALSQRGLTPSEIGKKLNAERYTITDEEQLKKLCGLR